MDYGCDKFGTSSLQLSHNPSQCVFEFLVDGDEDEAGNVRYCAMRISKPCSFGDE